MKKIITSIPVTICGALVFYMLLLSNCSGIVEIYGSLFLLIGMSSYLFAFYIVSLIQYFRTKDKINIRPILTLIFFIGLIVTGFIVHSQKEYNKKIILTATMGKKTESNIMELLQGEQIQFHYGHFEERCSCKGSYLMKGDTLIINEIDKPKRIVVYDKYLITKKYVIPILNDKLELDSSKYLQRFSSR